MINQNVLPLREALAIIGGSLSNPMKMPWKGYSISAKKCITGSKLRKVEGSTCSKCYALKGHYVFSNVANAHKRRLKAMEHPLWPLAMAIVINHEYRLNVRANRTYKPKGARKPIVENRFRIWDSGDNQSPEMVGLWCQVAQLTPHILYYMPTREVSFVDKYLKSGGTIPKNLIIRFSAPLVGRKPPKAPLDLQFSTVGCDDDKSLFQCPAMKQGNKCLDCNACWKLGINVNYHLH